MIDGGGQSGSEAAGAAVVDQKGVVKSAPLDFSTNPIPSPTLSELEDMCMSFKQINSLDDFSATMVAIQPDFSGRISGLSRALEWDGAPCSQDEFLKS